LHLQLGEHIVAAYNDSGWKGRLVRPLLRPPCDYYECEKLGRGQLRRTRRRLPPRVCLRPFGHRLFVWLTVVLAVVSFVFPALFPYDLLDVLFAVVCCAIAYCVGGAAVEALATGQPEPYVPPRREMLSGSNGRAVGHVDPGSRDQLRDE
jgi:hypothetical protein